jgi:hypothetical protein
MSASIQRAPPQPTKRDGRDVSSFSRPTSLERRRGRGTPAPAVEVPHGLGDAVVEEAHGDAAAVEHGEPLHAAELGLVVRPAELDLRVLAAQDVEQHADPQVLRRDVEPGPLVRDPLEPGLELLVGVPSHGDGVDDEAPDEDAAVERHVGVQLEVEGRAVQALEEGQRDAPPGDGLGRHDNVAEEKPDPQRRLLR